VQNLVEIWTEHPLNTSSEHYCSTRLPPHHFLHMHEYYPNISLVYSVLPLLSPHRYPQFVTAEKHGISIDSKSYASRDTHTTLTDLYPLGWH
jgi:hypothetical protein